MTLWKLQGNASFFVGDLPTTKEAYFKNYCLSIGTSVAHWAAAQSRRKGKDKVKIHSDNRRNLMPMGYLSLAVNHRLQHPGARVPWSCADLEELLNKSIAHRYTDSRSHLQPTFKATVEQAKQRFAQLPPSGLIREFAESIQHEKQGLSFNFFTIHNEAWLFLEMLHAAVTDIVGDKAVRKTINGAQTLPFVSGLCLATAAGRTLDDSQTMGASDTLLRVAADVLQAFVREGHGSTLRDVVNKCIDPQDVEGLHQGLALWALDDMDFSGGYQGPQPGGEEMEQLGTLLRMLGSN